MTDWIQAITGCVAVIGLIYTLYLQSKASLQQTKITLIEEERERRSLLPVFKVDVIKLTNNNVVYDALEIELNRNPAVRVKLIKVENKFVNFYDEIGWTDAGIDDWPIGKKKCYFFRLLPNEGTFMIMLPIMKIEYSDEGFSHYIQTVNIIGTHEGLNIVIKKPEQVLKRSGLTLKRGESGRWHSTVDDNVKAESDKRKTKSRFGFNRTTLIVSIILIIMFLLFVFGSCRTINGS